MGAIIVSLLGLLISLFIIKMFYDRLKSIESILKDIKEKIK